MSKPNYYHILGVDETSTEEAIKSRYRSMAKLLHPDNNKSPRADVQFKELQEAYAVLSNYELRVEHDATLALAKISDEPADEIDNVMEAYSITKPRKKKKKKKRRDVPIPPPPQQQRPQRQATADFEDIPPGFEPRLDFLGGH